MSWTNPFANTNTGLTEPEVQEIIDVISFSPIYTSQTEAQNNLLNYEVVRVELATNEINLPSFVFNGLHIRIYNEKLENLVVKDSADEVVATIYKEICSFYHNGSTWISFSSY